MAQVDHLRPWLALALVMGTAWTDAGYSAENGVDVTLRREAVSAHKPVHGIETAFAQARLLAGIPDPQALQEMEAILSDPHASIAQFERLEQLWLAGDVDGLGATLSQMGPEMTRLLLTHRNTFFADTVERLASGDRTALVTVGVGHMTGPDGLPTLLVRRGLQVERIE